MSFSLNNQKRASLERRKEFAKEWGISDLESNDNINPEQVITFILILYIYNFINSFLFIYSLLHINCYMNLAHMKIIILAYLLNYSHYQRMILKKYLILMFLIVLMIMLNKN